jgi:hypothetical protein
LIGRIGEDNRVTMTDPPSVPGNPTATAASSARSAAPDAPDGAGRLDVARLRLSRTPMDMTKAVLVLLVPVIVAVLVYVFFFGGSNPIVIDPSGTYSDATAANVFPVVQPHGLPSGWKPVSSSFDVEKGRHVLRVGYLAPDGSGLQLVESDGASSAAISDEIGKSSSVGTAVALGGRTWGQVDAGKNNQRALIDVEKHYTVIVKGQAPDADLRAFAASLR